MNCGDLVNDPKRRRTPALTKRRIGCSIACRGPGRVGSIDAKAEVYGAGVGASRRVSSAVKRSSRSRSRY